MSDICHLMDDNGSKPGSTRSICSADGWTDDHMFLSDYWSGDRICGQEVCTKCLELEPLYALRDTDLDGSDEYNVEKKAIEAMARNYNFSRKPGESDGDLRDRVAAHILGRVK